MVDSISSGYVFYRKTHVDEIECVWEGVEVLAHGGRGGRGFEDFGNLKSGGEAFLCTRGAKDALVQFGRKRHANVTSEA